jgi:hypothetical protein
MGRKLSCIEFTAPQLVSVVMVALHVAAGLSGSGSSLNPHLGQDRIALLLKSVTDKHPDKEHDSEGREDRPALPGVPDHPAEGVCQCRRNYQKQPHLEQVGDGIRIFERVSGIGVEEAAAVGAEFLDRLLGRYGSLRDGLLGAFHGGYRGVRLQILNHALRAQEQRGDEGDGQQHV